MRILGRAALALVTTSLGVAAAAPPGPASEAPPPAEEPWPFGGCGLEPVPLAGALAVQGLQVRARVAWTARDPAEVLACERAHLARLRVDLQDVPGALIARDHLGARTLLVAVRRVAPGSTEVVLAALRGQGVMRPAPLAHVPLPPQLLAAARVDDRGGREPVSTISGVCRGGVEEAREALTSALAGAGWVRASAALFTRGEETLAVAFAAAPGGCTFALRLVGGDP